MFKIKVRGSRGEQRPHLINVQVSCLTSETNIKHLTVSGMPVPKTVATETLSTSLRKAIL